MEVFKIMNKTKKCKKRSNCEIKLRKGEILKKVGPYKVTNYGRVFGRWNKLISPKTANNCVLKQLGTKVYSLFKGKVPNHYKVQWKDGNRLNNHVNNLQITLKAGFKQTIPDNYYN